MQPEWTSWPSAAEFPHDNPAFDRGALWTNAALCFSDPVEPVIEETVAPEASAEPEPAAPAEVEAAPTELEAATEAVVETATTTTTATTTATATTTTTATATATATATEAPIEAATSNEVDDSTSEAPRDDDPVATFVRAVTDVALAYGPAETAAHIESLFHFGTLASEELSATAQAALCEGRILETTDDGVRTTESFASSRTAWESILRGESGDLSACGESTLDTWTADLVARLIASPDKAQTIRRDLRRRGIAAFGMLS